MKNRFLMLILSLLFMSSFSFKASAQIAVSLELNRKNYLQYEHIFARIKLRNYTASTLIFGDKPEMKGSIRFEIYPPEGGIAALVTEDIPEMKGLLLKPGETTQVVIPVSKYYNLTNLGKYRVKAVIDHSQILSAYESESLTFSVSSGVNVWKTLVGMPAYIKKDAENSENGKIKTRQYRIASMFDGTDKVFYLIIEDDRHVYSIKRIGYEMANKVPECEIDALARLHIMQKLSSEVFMYMLYDIDGTLEKKEVYKKKETSPVLVRDPESGSVVVAGGIPAEIDKDYNESVDDIFK